MVTLRPLPSLTRRQRDQLYVARKATNAMARAWAAAGNNQIGLSLVDGSLWQWTESGSGTAEYYLEALGGGDPGIVAATVYENYRDALAGGMVGSLAAGEWAFDDNDTLGFDTVYVRLSNGGDPSAQASGSVRYA